MMPSMWTDRVRDLIASRRFAQAFERISGHFSMTQDVPSPSRAHVEAALEDIRDRLTPEALLGVLAMVRLLDARPEAGIVALDNARARPESVILPKDVDVILGRTTRRRAIQGAAVTGGLALLLGLAIGRLLR